MYDLMIAGGGPAGLAAGVYAARKRLNTLFYNVITTNYFRRYLHGLSLDNQVWIR